PGSPRPAAPRWSRRFSSRRRSYPSRLFLHVDPALPRHGQQPRHVAFGCTQAGGVLELAGGMAESEVEGLLLGIEQLRHQLVVLQIVHLGGLHWCSAPSRVTNFVFTGSLWPARRSASRASSSGTPASSNITLPGLTTATQPSGLPLPEPIRVSAGFLVYGLSGKTLIQTLPPRLILRVIATRAASIWRLLIQPRSSVFSPYSPKATVLPPLVLPRIRPRICLRYLTRFGISISGHLPPARRGPCRRRAVG